MKLLLVFSLFSKCFAKDQCDAIDIFKNGCKGVFHIHGILKFLMKKKRQNVSFAELKEYFDKKMESMETKILEEKEKIIKALKKEKNNE